MAATRHWATRAFRALLALYPGEFRDEYGREVAMVFTDRYRRATSALERTSIWLEGLAGVLREAPKEHVRTLAHDLLLAARTVRRSPGFAGTVVLTLALGIGANTAVFSIVNAALIRPLGFAQEDRLVLLHEGVPAAGIDRVPFSPADLRDVEAAVDSFDGLGAFRTMPVELSGQGGGAERLPAARVTAGLLPLLGVEPALGRLFSAGEDRLGSDLALISWELWQRRYGGGTGSIGQTILIDRRPHTIIGVMPSSFQFPRRGLQFNSEPADIWIPLAFADYELRRGGGFATSAIARLSEAATLTQAQAELDALAPRLQAEYPPALRNRDAAPLVLFASSLREEILGTVETPLLMLLAAIGLVMLVACSNVANLLLSRSAERQHEMGVRVALGASRLRLVQLQFSEALLLTIAGGFLGVLVARVALRTVPAVVTERVPGLYDVPLDLRVLVFAAGLSIVTAVVFAVVPYLATERRALLETLHESAARATVGLRRRRIQGSLVVATVALSFVLLVAAGLFLRSLSALLASDPGFRPAGVLTVSMALPIEAYPTSESVRAFQDSLLNRLRALPTVRTAALTTDLPLEDSVVTIFAPEGADAGTVPPTRRTHLHGAYFQALGISLKRGRFFTEDELAQNRHVVIVNEKLASRYWPGQDPIGKRMKFGPAQSPIPWLSIVGVVSDAVDGPEARATMGDDRPVHVYEPFVSAGSPRRDIRLAILTLGDPALVSPSVLRELADIDPQLAVARIETMEDKLRDVLAPRRFGTGLVAGFAGGALLLVSVGLYGLLAFGVVQRRREIGLRMALGAEPHTMLRMVLTDGVRLVGTGLTVGLVVTLATTRLLSPFLYETTPYDPVTLVVVPVVLAGVALLACTAPAWRASRVDSLVALQRG